jgi:hypothetical protein
MTLEEAMAVLDPDSKTSLASLTEYEAKTMKPNKTYTINWDAGTFGPRLITVKVKNHIVLEKSEKGLGGDMDTFLIR